MSTVEGDGPRVAPKIPHGRVQFGDLRRLVPISREWGYDRGVPVDRYYIEQFLARHSDDIRGRVLEIGDDQYTRRFGGDRVTAVDVLHRESVPQATIVADLTRADHIASDQFDCIVFTQTLQFIFDTAAALDTLRRILKPNGVLLATFPGISHIGDHEWTRSWYWNFTTRSARRLFEDAFPGPSLTLEAHGNVLAAISFLQGLAHDELSPAELDAHDPAFEVVVTARVVKTDDRAAGERSAQTS